MLRKVLLVCGILSPVLYAVSDLLAGMQYEGYSFRDQTISELGAIGAPTRTFFAVLLFVVYALMVAFGAGVWKSSVANRRLRVVGGLLIGLGVMALTVGQLAAMHLRGTEQGSAHLIEGMVAMTMTFTAMGIAATCFGPRFRLYTIATIVLALAVGGWAISEAPQIAQGLATPWVGVKERIFWYGYQSWFIVLALTLLRQTMRAGAGGAFKTREGEAKFIGAYDAAMKLWPVAFEGVALAGRFGTTHVIVSGQKDAPPLVLLHGYTATSVMWLPNIADFSRGYRVYAIDVMGQPSKSIPGEPIRNATDYVAWLTETLDGLHLDRVFLAGVSFGGWLALIYTVAAPERVHKLVLLSPGGFLPISKQFILRGMLMMFFPSRWTVRSFMRWAGFTERPGDTDGQLMLNVMHLGMKYFRMPPDTMRVAALPVSDDELRAMKPPVLLLMGENEVLCDAAAALARARRLIPHFDGELVPRCSHDMCFSQHRIIDARILAFLRTQELTASDRTKHIA